jgi:hypothetical protein
MLRTLRSALEKQPLPLAGDPLQWWRKQVTFSAFFPYVRAVLGVPASNTTAERLFSSTGFLSDGRPNLHIETLEHLAIVRHFLLTVEFDDEREDLIDAMMQRLDQQRESESILVT